MRAVAVVSMSALSAPGNRSRIGSASGAVTKASPASISPRRTAAVWSARAARSARSTQDVSATIRSGPPGSCPGA